MVDKMAESDPTKGKCAGRVLVPKTDPLAASSSRRCRSPTCGDRMPQALPMLKPDEIACVKLWAMPGRAVGSVGAVSRQLSAIARCGASRLSTVMT
jgi:hypothetical protein